MTELDKVDRISACIKRNATRFYESYGTSMPDPQWKAYRAWIRARHNYLAGVFAAAINDCDQIIGKQWHYDHMGGKQLPPEHGSG